MAYDGTIRFDTRLDASGFEQGASRMGDVAKGMIAFKIIEKGFQLIANSVDRAVARYDTLQRFPRVLELMGFSANDASAATQKLADGVDGLPTALDDVVSTAQRLTVLTGNLDTATDTTLALNNALLASGSTATDAARGAEMYIAMLSAGKVTMMRWRTLQETMGYALQKTAEAFGYAGDSAQTQLYEALRDGDITFSDFNAKLIELNDGVGGFAEMAKTASGGIGTAFINLKTRVAAGVAGIIEAFDRGLSQTRFKSIEGFIDDLGRNLKDTLLMVAGAFEFIGRNIEWLLPLLVSVGATITAWKIGKILTPIIAGFQTAALQVALYAASVGGAITVDALHTAGLTTKEVIVGVLTGKIGLVTAAQWLWNTAMAANPIGAVVAAVVAFVGVLAVLAGALSTGTEEDRKFNESLKESKERTDELTAATETNRAEREKRIRDSGLEATKTQILADKIKALAAVENKSAEQKRALKTQVDELNKLMPDLGLAVDGVTGSLNRNNEEISIAIGLKRDLAQAQETEKAMMETLDDLAVISARRLENDNLLKEANIRLEKEQAELKEKSVQTAHQSITAWLDAKTAVDALEASNIKLTESEQKLQAEYEEHLLILDELKQKTVDANVAMLDAEAEGYAERKAALEGFTASQLEEYEKYRSTVTNVFKRLNKPVKISLDEMIENLKQNRAQVKEWADGIEYLIKHGVDQGIIQQFIDAGPEASAAVTSLVDDMKNNGGKKLKELETEFTLTSDETVDAMAKVYGSSLVPDAAADMIKNTADAGKQAVNSANFQQIGIDMGDGIAAGVRDRARVVANMAANIVRTALAAARVAAGARSKARKFIPLGEDIDEGIAAGMAKAKFTQKAASDVVATAHATIAQTQQRAAGVTIIRDTRSAQAQPQAAPVSYNTTWEIHSPKRLGLRDLRQMSILDQQRARLGGAYG
jgi:tape measure domain-containing protein